VAHRLRNAAQLHTEAPSAIWYRYQAGRGFPARPHGQGKKPYIFVGLVCVREEYQGQGYMRKVLDIAFAEGNRLGVPVILETDAKSKCDKYVHLGMELAGTHDLGAFGKLYDLIKYPEPTKSNGTV